MSKLKHLLLSLVLVLLPLTITAQDEPTECGVECESGGDGENIEPYVPTACELRMWDIYSAADIAVQDLFKQPVCEEYVSSWYVGDDSSEGIEAFDSVNNFVNNTNAPNDRNVKKVVVFKKKLRRLRRLAASCR